MSTPTTPPQQVKTKEPALQQTVPVGLAAATVAAQPQDRVRGFRLGRRMLVRHLRTHAPHGWANAEGSNVVSSTIVSLSRCYEANIFQGWRLVVGRHAVWLLV